VTDFLVECVPSRANQNGEEAALNRRLEGTFFHCEVLSVLLSPDDRAEMQLLNCCAVSKKFKGKPCVYCTDGTAISADHVIARQFFLERHRANIPKAPACVKCNGEKSALEEQGDLPLE
jgi:hypothetical protein